MKWNRGWWIDVDNLSFAYLFQMNYSAESTESPAESTGPQATSIRPRAESIGPRAESTGPSGESIRPRAESTESPAESTGPQATSIRPRAESIGPRAESTGPSGESIRPRAESTESPAESTGPQAKSIRPRAESIGPRAESTDSPAELTGPQAESTEPPANRQRRFEPVPSAYGPTISRNRVCKLKILSSFSFSLAARISDDILSTDFLHFELRSTINNENWPLSFSFSYAFFHWRSSSVSKETSTQLSLEYKISRRLFFPRSFREKRTVNIRPCVRKITFQQWITHTEWASILTNVFRWSKYQNGKADRSLVPEQSYVTRICDQERENQLDRIYFFSSWSFLSYSSWFHY